MKNYYFLTVTGDDRPGIIAHVTGVVYRMKGNLEDVTMTVLEGVFMMALIVSIPARFKDLLPKSISGIPAGAKLICHSQKLNFRSFYKKNNSKKISNFGKILITAIGKDRTGIVYHIANILATRHLNITDLNSKIFGKPPKVLYALALEIDVKRSLNLKPLKSDLAGLAKKLKIQIDVKNLEAIEF